jgi:hypothetical protein
MRNAEALFWTARGVPFAMHMRALVSDIVASVFRRMRVSDSLFYHLSVRNAIIIHSIEIRSVKGRIRLTVKGTADGY